VLHAIKTIIVIPGTSGDNLVGMIRKNCPALEIVSVCDTIQAFGKFTEAKKY